MPEESVGIVDPPTTTRVSESLFGLESGVLEATVAVFVIAPAGDTTVTEMVSVAPEPAGIVPKLAVTVPLPFAQVPWLAEHDRYERPEGSGSVTLTARASAGPALETAIV